MFNHVKSSISSLSDELVIDILRRVPAHDILTCKTVCSLWRRLTDTEQFTERHLNNTPVILGWHSSEDCFFLINNNVGLSTSFWKVVDVQGMEIPRKGISVRASCNGLLLLGHDGTTHAICNPVTRELVTFRLSNRGIVCGFYFHRVEKEYKLLIKYNRYESYGSGMYSICGLSSTNKRALGTSKEYVRRIADIATCGALFWTTTSTPKHDRNGITLRTENIIMFDLDTETFMMKPQPGNRYKRGLRTQVKLLDIEGKLGCCDVYLNSVQVWILEDIEDWKWVNKYTVSFGRHISKKGKRRRLGDAETSVVGFQDGNLLLWGKVSGLMWCNLRSNTISKINTDNLPGWEKDDEDVYRYYDRLSGMHYVSSFLSLEKLNILSLDTSLCSDDYSSDSSDFLYE